MRQADFFAQKEIRHRNCDGFVNYFDFILIVYHKIVKMSRLFFSNFPLYNRNTRGNQKERKRFDEQHDSFSQCLCKSLPYGEIYRSHLLGSNRRHAAGGGLPANRPNHGSGNPLFAPDFQGSEEEALRLIVDRQLSPAPLGRAAFAERSLKTAVALGMEQYLLFGAGYDTFALRQPEWAQKLQIFELDLPESVADKQQRIQKAGLSIPENTFYLPVDLSQEEWQKILLEHKSFSPEKRSFCSLLGLVYYLPQEAFENLLDRLQDLLPEGSALVLDYPMK